MIAASSPAPRRFSVEEYHRMGEAGIFARDARVELLDGVVVSMMPIGPRHASVVDQLAASLFRAYDGRACVRVQNPLALSDWSEPEPDLAVVRGRCSDYAEAHPRPADVLLAIEVAESSVKWDREDKLPLYARAGVREVWLVDVAQRRIEVHTHPSADGYLDISIRGLDAELQLEGTEGRTLRVAEILG